MAVDIKKFRKLAKLNQDQVAERLGLHVTNYSRLENGHVELTIQRLEELAEIFGTTTEAMVSGKIDIDPPEQLEVDETLKMPPRESMPRNVPVRGTAAGSITGAIEISSDPVDYVRRPPGLGASPDVYAIYVTGDSMEPAHPHGALRFVHPGRPVSVGDTVIVITKDGENAPHTAYIKTIRRRTGSHYTLSQLNPEATIEIPTDKIIATHKVLTMNDLFGV
ncbi:MAG: XRE family transcriptional regulator [Hyphomicrobiales bacterium]|nr:MAG: XRE family transcriptional regulator [Hyphomicrobiales bacterium]